MMSGGSLGSSTTFLSPLKSEPQPPSNPAIRKRPSTLKAAGRRPGAPNGFSRADMLPLKDAFPSRHSANFASRGAFAKAGVATRNQRADYGVFLPCSLTPQGQAARHRGAKTQ